MFIKESNITTYTATWTFIFLNFSFLCAHGIKTIGANKCHLAPTIHRKEQQQTIAFMWPIDKSKFWISSFYGPRKKPNGQQGFHYGIDMAAVKHTPVIAAADGYVEQAYDDAISYGKTIVIKHGENLKTRYAHLQSILVKVGQKVVKGAVIGRVGDTGYVRKQGRDASHLHFEIYELGKRVNPLYFLQ